MCNCFNAVLRNENYCATGAMRLCVHLLQWGDDCKLKFLCVFFLGILMDVCLLVSSCVG
jgi:hypothetical protein